MNSLENLQVNDICSLIDVLRNQLNSLKIEIQNSSISDDDQIYARIAPLKDLIRNSRQDLDSIRYILSNFEKPIESNYDGSIKLSNEDYFFSPYITGHKPREIRFRGKIYFANNWNQMFPWLAAEIISVAEFSEEDLAQDKAFYGKKCHYFSVNPKELSKDSIKVGKNIWMETKLSAKQFKEIIWFLLRKADIMPGEVEIVLRR